MGAEGTRDGSARAPAAPSTQKPLLIYKKVTCEFSQTTAFETSLNLRRKIENRSER
jgi:hypothetical protein